MALICDEDAALRVLMMIAGVERHEQDDGWGTSIYRIGELADLAWGSHSRVVEQLEGAKVGLDACSKELRSRDHELMRIQDELKAMEAGMRSLEEALEEARRELNWERGAHAACMTQLDILVAKAAEGERRVLDGRAERELEVNLRLVRELEEDNARLREELRDSVEARAAHVRRLSEDERRGEELMGEVSRLETACDLLRAEMGEVETALKEEVDLRDERIRDISASLAGRDGRIASLEDERDAALSAAAAVRGELGVISSQKQSLEAENAALRRAASTLDEALSSISKGTRQHSLRLELASTPSKAHSSSRAHHLTFGPGSPPPVDLVLPSVLGSSSCLPHSLLPATASTSPPIRTAQHQQPGGETGHWAGPETGHWAGPETGHWAGSDDTPLAVARLGRPANGAGPWDSRSSATESPCSRFDQGDAAGGVWRPGQSASGIPLSRREVLRREVLGDLRSGHSPVDGGLGQREGSNAGRGAGTLIFVLGGASSKPPPQSPRQLSPQCSGSKESYYAPSAASTPSPRKTITYSPRSASASPKATRIC